MHNAPLSRDAYFELIRKIFHLDGCRDQRFVMEDDV